MGVVWVKGHAVRPNRTDFSVQTEPKQTEPNRTDLETLIWKWTEPNRTEMKYVLEKTETNRTEGIKNV